LPDLLVQLDADRELNALAVQAPEHLLLLKARVGADQDRPARPGATHPGQQLIEEALLAALPVRLPLAVADVQHLGAAGARGEQRLVAELVPVALAGALLLVARDLTDERVDVDHQPLAARTCARRP